jgi:hypothetical protein
MGGRMRRIVVVSGLLSIALLCRVAFAQTPPPPAAGSVPETQDPVLPEGTVDLETIVVSGKQPGPGLWKVRSGERTLWILGTQNPLPKRMEWDSANVERRIAASQELLMPPSVDLDADVGFFRGLTLLPSLFKARKNPDGKTLNEVLPAAQYARWLALKKRYIGSDGGIEAWRPVFAALELYDKAITRSGMSQDPVVSDAVRKAAKRSKVKITSPTVKIKIANAKAALREFSSEALNDQDCFQRTLDRIESDLGTMVGRANAWAEGDVEALRSLPYQNQFTACSAVFTGNAVARKQGMSDIQARVENAWMAAAEKSLSQNASTFAVLPVGQLMQPGGFLDKLAAKGYVIEEP